MPDFWRVLMEHGGALEAIVLVLIVAGGLVCMGLAWHYFLVALEATLEGLEKWSPGSTKPRRWK